MSSLHFLPKQVEKKIIHIDMDCFFAAVEMRDNPTLKEIPLAIGGKPEQRGVISTCNYIARKFGVHSAMSSAYALKLCPNLTIIRGNFDKYREASNIIRKIFHQYTSLVEPLSLDEAFLDITNSNILHGSGTLIAQKIREEIFQETKLTASAGVAPNKFLAKIASDWNKPNGLYVIRPHEIQEFIEKLPVRKIWGVGKVTEKKLHQLNIKTCKEIQGYSLTELVKIFGSQGHKLYQYAYGIDNRDVEINYKRKSISHETTFSKDLQSLDECLKHIDLLLNELIHRVSKFKKTYKADNPLYKCFVKIKFKNFKVKTNEKIMPKSFFSPLWDDLTVTKEMKLLLTQLLTLSYHKEQIPVRLIGMGVKLKETDSNDKSQQLFLFKDI